MRIWCILWLALMPVAVSADERVMLYGTWGDARQCAGDLLLPGGTQGAAPFVLNDGWLRHGQTWCSLSWFPAQIRPDGVFASARALCGEDSARSFRLDILRRGDTLRLIWDEAMVNGPLLRCDAR